ARLAHVLVTCPESEGNELVRVRLLRYRVGLGDQLSTRPAESCNRQIEGVPEELNRARLSAVPAGELLEHRGRPTEDLPEALDRIAVVRGVLGVPRKRRRHRHPERHLLDLDVDPETLQRRV